MIPILVTKKLDHKFGTVIKDDYFAIVDSMIVLPSIMLKTISRLGIVVELFNDINLLPSDINAKTLSNSITSDIIKDLNTPAFSILYYGYNKVYSTVDSLEIRGHDIMLEHQFPNYNDDEIVLLIDTMTVKSDNHFSDNTEDLYYQIHKVQSHPIVRILRNKDLKLNKWNIPGIHRLYSRASEIRDILVQTKSLTNEMITEAQSLDRRSNGDEDFPF